MARFLVALFLALPWFTGAQAATYLLRSDGTGDYPTIQAAIAAAEDGDIIALADGVYTGPGNRDVDFAGKAVTIRSQSADPQNCVIDCQGSSAAPHRGFKFVTAEQSDSVLENLTIVHGWNDSWGGGAIMCDWSSPTITGCIFSGNTAGWNRGGALMCMNSSPLLLYCVFRGNTADGGGGMHCSNRSTPVLVGCRFEDNIADVGAGLACSSTCTPDIRECVFLDNFANGAGGAMYCDNAAPTVANCTFVNNAAGYFAGSIGGSFPNPPPSIINSIVAFGGNGQPIWCESGPPPVLTCCNIFGNEDGNWAGCIAGQAGLNGNLSIDPLFCDLTSGDLTLNVDSECLPDNNDCATLIGALPQGCSVASSVDVAAQTKAVLICIYPNPFNPRTTIKYDLPEAGAVRLSVFDLAGRLVRTLVDDSRSQGSYEAFWDGRDATGKEVSSGSYLARLEFGGEVETVRMGLVR